MWFIKRNLSADWNPERERDWEWGRAVRALRNAVFFLVFGLVLLAGAFANAWSKGSPDLTRQRQARERAAAESCRF